MKYGLVLVEPPVSEPVTLAQQKVHARIARDDEDSLVNGYLRAARLYAETFQRRQLLTATWRLTLDAFPACITLPLPPLQTVDSITYVDADGATQTLAPAAYLVDSSREPGRIVPAYGQCWPRTRCQPNAVSVTFTAGYGALPTDVPETTRQAIKLLAGHYYENRESATAQSLSDIPLGVESLLSVERWGGAL
jgi:uncharacterized phiE125 gp8 family phage protein